MRSVSLGHGTDLQALYAEGVLTRQHLVRRRQGLQAHRALQQEVERLCRHRRRQSRGFG